MVKISGWESKTLGTLINEGKIVIQTGPFGSVLSAKEFVKYGIPVVAVREIREGYIQIFDETPCVSMETKEGRCWFSHHSGLRTWRSYLMRNGSVSAGSAAKFRVSAYFRKSLQILQDL